MRTIYYFSGTGNTLYLGKYLKENCLYNLVNISTIVDEKVILSGEVGLLFPVYAMGIPRIMEEFLNKVEIEEVDYLFAIATCGGSGYGIPFNQIDNKLIKKGKKLDYSEYCHMPDNYLKLFKALPENEAKIDIESSKDKIKIISENILARERAAKKSSAFLYPLFILIYKFWRYNLKNAFKKFKLDEKRCIGCGICKEVCPVENIDLISEKPVWNNRCEDCLACVNLCPTVAISCGGKSKYENRYKNPYIEVNELKKWPENTALK